MKTFKFKLKNGTKKEMSIEELTRWACLLEGIEEVAKKCEELGVDMDKEDWVKPLAFQKYIEERYHSMKHDLSVEALMGRI